MARPPSGLQHRAAVVLASLHRPVFFGALAVAVLSASLHVIFALSAGPLWRDEVHSVNFATGGTLSDLLSRLWLDSFPILYSLVLRIAASLSDSDLYFRTVGVLLGMTYLAATFVGVRAVGKRLPILSLTMAISCPIFIRTLDSVRPYSLGVLAGILFIAAMQRYLRAPSVARYAQVTAAAVIATQSLYQSSFLILSMCLAPATLAASQRHWRRSLLILSVGAWPAASLAVYLGVFADASYWIVTQQNELEASLAFDMFAATTGRFVFWAGLFGGTTVLIVDRWRRERNRQTEAQLSTCVAIALCVPLYVFGFVGSDIPPAPHRFVPLLAWIAFALDCAVPRWANVRTCVSALALLIVALQLSISVETAVMRQTNIDRVAAVLAKRAGPNDLVVLVDWSAGISFSRYFNDDSDWTTIPPIDDHSIHRYDLLRRLFESEAPLDKLFDEIDRVLESGGTIYMVGTPPGESSREPPPAPHPRRAYFKGVYLEAWKSLVARHLAVHATTAEPISVPIEETVDARENLDVFAVRGWRPQGRLCEWH